ncbi:MAG: prepilin-type N-terminal cleavage/methylation domain-containing protein [Myxococcota bacterium]|jgi:prepilin-type N-terminal cleavage/methylation domain-containing protein|nr:prepilin-type N-terminal cleavage/methylation domain-containing protein [Myxococcota bacterium]
MSRDKRTHRQALRQQGFTLMEMMISLVAGAVLVTPLYLVLRGMSETSSVMRDAIEARQRSRVGISVLQRDLARVGLGVSPDSQVDGRSANRDASGSFAEFRRALILISDDNGNDALMLSGNFRGGKTYRAVANGHELTIFSDASQTITQDECLSQFDNASIGSFAHVTGSRGKELDARATGVFNSGNCVITLVQVDSPDGALDSVYGSGDTVFVSSNQTVLYMLEPMTDHLGMPSGQLVRYFVSYDGSIPPAPGSCSIDVLGVPTLPGGTALIATTRQVIVDYAENFQVWLRVVAAAPNLAGGTRAYAPHYTAPLITDYLGDGLIPTEGDGFKPAEGDRVMPASSSDGADYSGELGCGVNATRGVQHVRSALVQLSVRTERTDNSMDWQQAEHITRIGYRMAPLPAGAPAGREKTDAAYRVETFVTEVLLPNLAGRGDLLAQ